MSNRGEAPRPSVETAAEPVPPPGPAAPPAHRSVRQPLPHNSAVKHVTGAATFVDDILEPDGTLHLAVGLSPVARGVIARIDLDPVRAMPGVVAVLTAADIPGVNDVSPAFGDDPLLAQGHVVFHGQALFTVIARSRDQAMRAARRAVVEIGAEPPSVTVEDALARDETVLPDYAFTQGDAPAALAAAGHVFGGVFRLGGQEHFYLEGQAALAIPGEDGDILVHSSTQHPSEVQHVVAHVLGLPDSFVTCEVRRMGGAFGGKESQATQWAALAALGAWATGKPCKIRLDRDDDMILTGKRHDFRADWKLGCDAEGGIQVYDVDLLARCGCSADLSLGVVDRAMFHADNAYHLPVAAIRSRRLKTNTVSNTAFRGFGGPQGVLAIEQAIEDMARRLGLDPLDVRLRNLYGPGRDATPYGMTVVDHDAGRALIEALERNADYRARRADIAAFNLRSPLLRKGIALTPVKFGISFTLPHLNQAGALVHVYQDGSIVLNHGGTEMGQGLFVKVAQVVAEEFGVGLERVRVSATSTSKVPNTSPTAASAGSDLNGMAAREAVSAIRGRLAAHLAAKWSVAEADIVFADDMARSGNHSVAFGDLAKEAYLARIPLSATGFYKTPGITWNRAEKTGDPFFYFAWGAACSEVTIDTLTGEMRVDRVDILHDCGSSLNPAIDIGQIEGGFVQGMGWLTTEELVFDKQGRLRTHAPSTYKIPVASDVPADFRVALFDRPNRAETIYRSKAVGEPPLMLATSVWCAIFDAVRSLLPPEVARTRGIPLVAPATPEAILNAIGAARAPVGA